jgi:CheY-like chemotaxis protein
MKILVAEDDPSIQTIAKLTLQKVGGHDVTVVENGREALERAKSETFDLIILDGMMPEMDGFQACQHLKADPVTQSIPVIFMTAKNQQNDVEEGYKAGAIGYIVKPFDAQQLCSEIQKIFSKHLWNKAS